MKTTFSYFPGMFENPAPTKYYLKKSKNDLLGIKLIILRSELNVATFWICMDAIRSSVLVVFNNFLLIDATEIEVRILAINSAYFSP